MKVCKRQLFYQLEGGLKIFVRLSWKTNDHIRAYCSIGRNLPNPFHALGIMASSIPTVHGLKNAIGTRLQGHMKVTRQARRLRHERNQFLRNVLGLDGAETKLFQISFFQYALDHVE